MANAIGVLETKGMVALVKGVDAMLKAASVSLAGQYKDVGSAYMSASVVGDVAYVKAAVEAGATAASEIGTVVSVHVIARPHDNTAAVLSPKPAKK